MKMMQGAFFLPCSNMSRTRLAPTPTNISTESEPEMVKNGTLASPAMARASKVVPVRGGPTSNPARGTRPAGGAAGARGLPGAGRPAHHHAPRNAAPERLELAGVTQEFGDLLQVGLRL